MSQVARIIRSVVAAALAGAVAGALPRFLELIGRLYKVEAEARRDTLGVPDGTAG